MKKFSLFIVLIISFSTTFAFHIIGGEMTYQYLGLGSQPNTLKYQIILKVFRGNSGATLNNTISLTIFNTNSGSIFQVVNNVALDGPYDINFQTTDRCITPVQTIAYQIGYYRATVELPTTLSGYTIAYQRCCRRSSIINLLSPDSQGATYFTTIPGTILNSTYPQNSSPSFANRDSSAICKLSPFSLDFSASDTDGDSLVYRFGPAYTGGANNLVIDPKTCGGVAPDPACWPFNQCTYNTPSFTALTPLGSLAFINSRTGVISGIAPNIGDYVVAVYCDEYRNGIKFNSHYKEFLVTVADCEKLAAVLNPKPTTCDGFIVSFQNDAPNSNPLIDYVWTFGDPASGTNDTSTLANPTHDYTLAGAGNYIIKLKVSFAGNCADSTTSTIKVYPGFRPAFEVLGQCKNTPIQFNDLSVHDFGTINKWTWNFADPSSGANNTSTIKNPTHIFAASGTYKVTLLVESDKGCSATIPKDVVVQDKPAFTVFPKDTLICTIDDLQIGVTGSGTVLWSPNYNINNVNSPNPIVSPDVTTTYTATFTDAFGCTGSDNVKINVVDKVTQGNNYDTTICTGDGVVLRLFSNALYYTWTPNDGSLNSTTIKNPTATPLVTTDYFVTGKISNICFAQNKITITPVPYPTVVAPNVNVCFGKPTQLQASGGSTYSWSPSLYLSATNIPNPQVINPKTSVNYTLTVRDILGCPKPVQKIVKLNVIKINANAGPRDTSVVLGQPLFLNATGGTDYLWVPLNTWLSNINIHNPIALPQNDIEYIVRVSDTNNCFAFDSIRVHLYRVKEGLYVPNAFTPNGDNKNDYFVPIALGIKTLDLFQVYNRWGQLVYSSPDLERGWDGTFGGRPQDPGNFVWVANATDYKGNKIRLKGNVILIRQ